MHRRANEITATTSVKLIFRVRLNSKPPLMDLLRKLGQYVLMLSNSMTNIEYRRCILCGRKRVAPINRNPLKYPRLGACPSCTRLDDFEEQMKRYKEKAKELRYINTPTP